MNESLRIIALEHATRTMPSHLSGQQLTTEAIVSRAEAFLKFLTDGASVKLGKVEK